MVSLKIGDQLTVKTIRKTALARGMPFTRATERTARSNGVVWMATVGTPYLLSMVIACTATAGAHVLQWPTPTIAASRLARLRWSEIIEHLLQTATAATFRVATLVVPAVASHRVRQRITLPGKVVQPRSEVIVASL